MFCFWAPCNPSFAQGDIVFVTQPEFPNDFATVNSTFANHEADLNSTPRGGDLWIRYASDGSLRNLTEAAGYGNSGFQGASSIAVRDPAVHWDAERILFSMVIGAPSARYQQNEYYWQLYEIRNFGREQTPVITKVASQPQNANNIMPAYTSNDDIVFISDRAFKGLAHLYPQLDEYESTPSNSGLWKLRVSDGGLEHLDHSPSGNFTPIVDSFGRIIFTRWDHLQRDQQNISSSALKAVNFASEASGSTILTSKDEYFPEPKNASDPDVDPNISLHQLNQFFPWMVFQDGTELETLNHIGRHELREFIGESFLNDSSVVSYFGQYPRNNALSLRNMFQIIEHPQNPGLYIGIDAQEFGTHASGQIISLNGAPDVKAADMNVGYLTHPDTRSTSDSPSADHVGLFRDPLITASGTFYASHTSETRRDQNVGSAALPKSRYAFRIKRLEQNQAGYLVPGAPLTSGITKTLWYWNPDNRIDYQNATLWELQPREVRVVARPPAPTKPLPAPERGIFEQLNVSEDSFRDYLVANDLALIVSRDVTSRDALDRQQPFSLQVEGGEAASVPSGTSVYTVSHLELIGGFLLRGYRYNDNLIAGRRVLGFPLSSVTTSTLAGGGDPGNVRIASDGSLAALVPARRAMSWQLNAPNGAPVVRERYWLTFQPGEIRVCASCHGLSDRDQLGRFEPTNAPDALFNLLSEWKSGETPPPPADEPNLPPSDSPSDPNQGNPGNGGDEQLDENEIRMSIKRQNRRRSRKARNISYRLSLETLSSEVAEKGVTLAIRSRKRGCSLDSNLSAPAYGSVERYRVNIPRGAGKVTFTLTRDAALVQSLRTRVRGRSPSKKRCKLRLRAL